MPYPAVDGGDTASESDGAFSGLPRAGASEPDRALPGLPRAQASGRHSTGRAGAGVGASEAADGYTAGREAARRACGLMAGPGPALVVVTASVRYDLPPLLAGVRSVTGDSPLVGATGDGHFLDGRYVPRDSGVAVCVIPGGSRRYGTAAVRGVRDRPCEAGRVLARAARDAVPGGPGPADAFLLLSDGLRAGQQRLLAGVHRVAGARAPVVGGTAADDRRWRHTFVFHNDGALADAAVGVWVAAEQPPRVVATHSWSPTGRPLLVTAARGPVISEIEGRPAARVYAEQLRADPDAIAAAPAARFPMQRLRPLGLLQPDGSHLIRCVRTSDDVAGLADGDLLAFSDIPSSAAVQLMRTSCESVLQATKRLVAGALDRAAQPTCLLVFSCALHQEVCGDRTAEQVGLLADVAGGVPSFGFHTYGEFARTVGGSGFHNAALSALVL